MFRRKSRQWSATEGSVDKYEDDLGGLILQGLGTFDWEKTARKSAR